MKTIPSQSDPGTRPQRTVSGHTLIEMMFAVTILVMVVLALLSANWVGMRQNQLVESKGGASDSSRRALSQLPVDIRSSKMWSIGSLSGSTFTPVADGAAQQGTALQLCSTTNGSVYVIYYFDLTDANNSNGKLMRATNSNWVPVIIASNLINTLYFTAEDYTGTIQTNDGSSRSYKNVIHATLQYAQFQYPLTMVGSNYLYDYYRMDIMATPHLPE